MRILDVRATATKVKIAGAREKIVFVKLDRTYTARYLNLNTARFQTQITVAQMQGREIHYNSHPTDIGEMIDETFNNMTPHDLTFMQTYMLNNNFINNKMIEEAMEFWSSQAVWFPLHNMTYFAQKADDYEVQQNTKHKKVIPAKERLKESVFNTDTLLNSLDHARSIVAIPTQSTSFTATRDLRKSPIEQDSASDLDCTQNIELNLNTSFLQRAQPTIDIGTNEAYKQFNDILGALTNAYNLAATEARKIEKLETSTKSNLRTLKDKEKRYEGTVKKNWDNLTKAIEKLDNKNTFDQRVYEDLKKENEKLNGKYKDMENYAQNVINQAKELEDNYNKHIAALTDSLTQAETLQLSLLSNAESQPMDVDDTVKNIELELASFKDLLTQLINRPQITNLQYNINTYNQIVNSKTVYVNNVVKLFRTFDEKCTKRKHPDMSDADSRKSSSFGKTLLGNVTALWNKDKDVDLSKQADAQPALKKVKSAANISQLKANDEDDDEIELNVGGQEDTFNPFCAKEELIQTGGKVSKNKTKLHVSEKTST